MIKNNTDSQQTGLFPLSFEATSMMKNYENTSRDKIDEFSFTNKSKEDFFNNQVFEDYVFGTKVDFLANSKPGSPITRSQREKLVQQAKQQLFSYDLSKHTNCPMCKQTLPKSPKKDDESPIKSPINRSKNILISKTEDITKRSKESSDSDFNLEKCTKKTEHESSENK